MYNIILKILNWNFNLANLLMYWPKATKIMKVHFNLHFKDRLT